MRVLLDTHTFLWFVLGDPKLSRLARLFIDEGQRIVFWHDPAHEFIDFMNRLPFLTFDHTTVQIIRLERVGGLEAKIRLERDDPEGRFLVYAPTEEPDYEEDWLLDIRLYSRSFRADRASMILDELGLENHHLREHLAERRTFFDHKDRLQKLKALVSSDDTADDLDRKMLAVVVNADQPDLFSIIRRLFHALTDVEEADEIDLGTPPACWDQLETFDLAQPFWRFIRHAFGARRWWHHASLRIHHVLTNAHFNQLGVPRLAPSPPRLEPPDADPPVRWCGRDRKVTIPLRPLSRLGPGASALWCPSPLPSATMCST